MRVKQRATQFKTQQWTQLTCGVERLRPAQQPLHRKLHSARLTSPPLLQMRFDGVELQGSSVSVVISTAEAGRGIGVATCCSSSCSLSSMAHSMPTLVLANDNRLPTNNSILRGGVTRLTR